MPIQLFESDIVRKEIGNEINISPDDERYKKFERFANKSDVDWCAFLFHRGQPYFPLLFGKYVLGLTIGDFREPYNVSLSNYIKTACAKCGNDVLVHSSFKDAGVTIPPTEGAVCRRCCIKYKYWIPVTFVAKKDRNISIKCGVRITNECIYRVWNNDLKQIIHSYDAKIGDIIRFYFNLINPSEIIVDIIKPTQ